MNIEPIEKEIEENMRKCNALLYRDKFEAKGYVNQVRVLLFTDFCVNNKLDNLFVDYHFFGYVFYYLIVILLYLFV